MRASTILLLTSVLAACAEDGVGDGAADIIQGDDEKADGTVGIEVTARIEPGSVDAGAARTAARHVRRRLHPRLPRAVARHPQAARELVAKFGEDFILLPKSMYGSWEKNSDDNSL